MKRADISDKDPLSNHGDDDSGSKERSQMGKRQGMELLVTSEVLALTSEK